MFYIMKSTKTNATDLQNAPVIQSFKAYLLPAMFAMVIKALYILIDTIFVGRGVGPLGIGAMAMTVPFFSVFTAVALTVGLGGATLMSMALGRGDKASAQDYFNQSLLFLTIVEFILIAIGMYYLPEILNMMGAKDELATLTYDYVIVMLPFFFAQGVGHVLLSFIRNDGNPKLVMYAILVSAVLNTVLDYIFIFPLDMGIKGAAWATAIAQVSIVVFALYHFKLKRGVLKIERVKLQLSHVPMILKIGLPTLFIESTTAVTVIVFNKVLLTNYTDMHVSVYGIINNVGLVILFLLIGVGQACQPIMSYNHGANRKERIIEAFKLGTKTALGIGVATVLIMVFGSSLVAGLFVVDNEVLVELSSSALIIYFLSTPLMGVNAMVASLFQSIGSSWNSTVISLLRGFLFVVVGILFLPSIFGEAGIWASVLFAEALTFILSAIMFRKYTNG